MQNGASCFKHNTWKTQWNTTACLPPTLLVSLSLWVTPPLSWSLKHPLFPSPNSLDQVLSNRNVSHICDYLKFFLVATWKKEKSDILLSSLDEYDQNWNVIHVKNYYWDALLFFGTKYLKPGLHFTDTAHLDLDWPHLKYSWVTQWLPHQTVHPQTLALPKFSWSLCFDKPLIFILPHSPHCYLTSVLAPSTSC